MFPFVSLGVCPACNSVIAEEIFINFDTGELFSHSVDTPIMVNTGQ
jgi:hypothetical protein